MPDPNPEVKTRYELTDPDVRLMLRVRDNDNTAFRELVEKYQGRLVGILNHLVSDRETAEDLAQDVFLRVYRARERYVPTAKFSTWLFTITHNVASNSLRKSSRRKGNQSRFIAFEFDASASAGDDGQREKRL